MINAKVTISELHSGHPKLELERTLLIDSCRKAVNLGGAFSINSKYVGNELITTYTIYWRNNE